MLSVGRELTIKRFDRNSHRGVSRQKAVGPFKISTLGPAKQPVWRGAALRFTSACWVNLHKQIIKNNLTNPSFRMRLSCACALMLIGKIQRRSDDRRNSKDTRES